MRSRQSFAVLTFGAWLGLTGCGGDDGSTPDAGRDAGPDLPDRVDPDLDTDGDSILDVHEGMQDADGDGEPNAEDLDSDGDGIPDAIEAGDGETTTPPNACANEVDPVTGEVAGDGYADFSDADSDNDGLSDGEEEDAGTDPCNVDTDADGQDDLAEGTYQRINCPDGSTGVDCGCATNASCHIPDSHFYVVLPYLGEPERRDLSFGTTIRIADVFFLTDTTASMRGTLDNVKATVTTPGTGLVDRIRVTVSDAWFGGGAHDDFPFGGWGSPPDDEPLIVAITMSPPSEAEDVQAAFDEMILHFGGDGPESQTEALYQIVTGEGGTWMWGDRSYTMPHFAGDCLDGGWGAACFREAALPIIVHFTDICSHDGPPGDDIVCDPYTGLTPAAHTWNEMIAAVNARGAKYVGINAAGRRPEMPACREVVGPSGYSPCFFMTRTAEETGSVDLDGNPLVYDLPNTGTDPVVFADTIVGAIETVVTRVPIDVDTALRDDDGDDIDATRFIRRRQPACLASPPTDPCWTPPAGTTHEAAVSGLDDSGFFGVIPGTTVLFRITFENDFLPGERIARVFVAYIDVRAGGSAVLDTRQVYIVVPAVSASLG